jgi:hypothetical protein
MKNKPLNLSALVNVLLDVKPVIALTTAQIPKNKTNHLVRLCKINVAIKYFFTNLALNG